MACQFNNKYNQCNNNRNNNSSSNKQSKAVSINNKTDPGRSGKTASELDKVIDIDKTDSRHGYNNHNSNKTGCDNKEDD